MNGPLIIDIIAAADVPSFPWGRTIAIIAVIVIAGVITAIFTAIRSEYGRTANIGSVVIVTFAAVVATLLISVSVHGDSNPVRPAVAAELSEAYGVAVLEDGGHEFGFLPIKPLQAADFTILVDGTPRECTIATSSDRYSISCEQGKDVIVLTPKENS